MPLLDATDEMTAASWLWYHRGVQALLYLDSLAVALSISLACAIRLAAWRRLVCTT